MVTVEYRLERPARCDECVGLDFTNLLCSCSHQAADETVMVRWTARNFDYLLDVAPWRPFVYVN